MSELDKPERCTASVFSRFAENHTARCARHAIDGELCSVHAPAHRKAREERTQRRRLAEQERVRNAIHIRRGWEDFWPQVAICGLLLIFAKKGIVLKGVMTE